MKRRQLLPILLLATLGVCSGTPPTEWATTSEEAESNASYRDGQIVSASIDGSGTWVGPVGKLRSLQIASNGAHRDVRVMPTFHLATDHLGGTIHADVLRAGGLTGKGVALGVVDSGLDLRHADFQNADGTTRVKWFIDFGLPLSGRYPELEKKFGIPSEDVPCEIKTPAVCYGAIFSSADLDPLIKDPAAVVPYDFVGHGSHVTGIAAGAGRTKKYTGVAPDADLIIVRARGPGEEGTNPTSPQILHGMNFIFDRAQAMGEPVAVNLSIATSLPAADGSDLFERALTQVTGPSGRIVVAAAGNDGYVGDGLAQTVALAKDASLRVPVTLNDSEGAYYNVFVAVAAQPGKPLRVGLDSDTGRWLTPIATGSRQADIDGVLASVTWDPALTFGLVPPGSSGALIWIRGKFKDKTVYVRLEGEGTSTLRLNAFPPNASNFTNGTRETTVALPARAPNMITVGCTTNRTVYHMITGQDRRLPDRISLDPAGGIASPTLIPAVEGAVCSFSSSGPISDGSMKPEILAPGAGIISAQSVAASEGSTLSIFNGTYSCVAQGLDKRCLLVEPGYGISSGTSMSSPVVAGVAALLLQRNPKLTQDQMRMALMAGVHRWRVGPTFNEQSGAGEIDAVRALEAVDRMAQFKAVAPVLSTSWMALSSDYARASGDMPVQVVLELRGKNGELADIDNEHLESITASIQINGEDVARPPIVKRMGPGLFSYRYAVPAGLGTGVVKFGALYNGVPVVDPKQIPISTDWWSSKYATSAVSACSASPFVGTPRTSLGAAWTFLAGAVSGALWLRRRRR